MVNRAHHDCKKESFLQIPLIIVRFMSEGGVTIQLSVQ